VSERERKERRYTWSIKIVFEHQHILGLSTDSLKIGNFLSQTDGTVVYKFNFSHFVNLTRAGCQGKFSIVLRNLFCITCTRFLGESAQFAYTEQQYIKIDLKATLEHQFILHIHAWFQSSQVHTHYDYTQRKTPLFFNNFNYWHSKIYFFFYFFQCQ
jgi:hypothetical protein